MQVLKMFRQNVIKKILINTFTMLKFFYTYKSREFYFLKEGDICGHFQAFFGNVFPKNFS